jgi:hypothetical protein
MDKWWKSGFKYAKTKREELMSEFRPDVLDWCYLLKINFTT